jgi:hypothetical protein
MRWAGQKLQKNLCLTPIEALSFIPGERGDVRFWPLTFAKPGDWASPGGLDLESQFFGLNPAAVAPPHNPEENTMGTNRSSDTATR